MLKNLPQTATGESRHSTLLLPYHKEKQIPKKLRAVCNTDNVTCKTWMSSDLYSLSKKRNALFDLERVVHFLTDQINRITIIKNKKNKKAIKILHSTMSNPIKLFRLMDNYRREVYLKYGMWTASKNATNNALRKIKFDFTIKSFDHVKKHHMKIQLDIQELGNQTKIWADIDTTADNKIKINEIKKITPGILPLLNYEILNFLANEEKKGNSIIAMVLLDQLKKENCIPTFNCLANEDIKAIQLDATDRLMIMGPQRPTTAEDLHPTRFAKSY